MSLEWKSCKIGDVVSVRRGASPRPIKDYVSETGMPWVKIADATKDQTRFINFTNEFIKEEGIEKSVVVNPGDLIVSNSATPGLPKFMNIKACVHDGWLVFDSYNGILKDFLYYYFIVIRGQLVNQANGSVFKNLKTDIVRNFDINLPDLETQKKIVKILSQIDKKIEINIEINNNLVVSKTSFCPNCGTENSIESKFCYECGTSINGRSTNRKSFSNQNYTSNNYTIANDKKRKANNKSSIISLILAFIWPGLGLIYNGLVKRGFVVMLVCIVFVYIDVVIYMLIWLAQLFDSYLTLNAMRKGKKPKLLAIMGLPDGW